jgi:hypothetical protein
MSHVSHRQDEKRRRLPPWLLGLIIATILFLVGLLVFAALGFGDNPIVEPEAGAQFRLLLGW